MNTKNWWTDPNNKEQVERLSWWEHPENLESYPIPLAVVQDREHWIVAGNAETESLLGFMVSAAQGKSKEQAIQNFFRNMRFMYEFQENERLRFQRWVPFRMGPWGSIGGHWFSVFGIHIYFRVASQRTRKFMKYGWFMPFTNLNISFSSDWKVYREYKKRNGKI